MCKKIASFLLAFVVAFGMTANSFAAAAVQESRTIRVNLEPIEVPAYDSKQVYDALKEIGFTDEEMFELYQREADESGVDVRLPDALAIAMGAEYAYTTFPGKIMPYSEPQDGDEKFTVYEIDFGDIARACGWTGHLVSAGDFIIQAGALAFKKAVIAELGVAVLGVAVLIDTLETIFDELDGAYEGVTLTVKSVYYYDEYERLGKWYMVYADYTFWK